ncbi:MAG: AI-2E family transporter, partial [Chloroflexi bacterium]|nr:AI-2E family transporter [Chloroflexota bacterium]
MTEIPSAADRAAVADVTADALAAQVNSAGYVSRIARLNVAVGILTAIALVAALYLARAFFVPLLIGILASYALKPVADWLHARRIPLPLAAALLLAVLVGGMSWITFSLSDDATAIIERLPEAARKLRQHLSDARTSSPTALQNMQEAANELQGAATDAGA